MGRERGLDEPADHRLAQCVVGSIPSPGRGVLVREDAGNSMYVVVGERHASPDILPDSDKSCWAGLHFYDLLRLAWDWRGLHRARDMVPCRKLLRSAHRLAVGDSQLSLSAGSRRSRRNYERPPGS